MLLIVSMDFELSLRSFQLYHEKKITKKETLRFIDNLAEKNGCVIVPIVEVETLSFA